jgi:hypothetical protein
MKCWISHLASMRLILRTQTCFGYLMVQPGVGRKVLHRQSGRDISGTKGEQLASNFTPGEHHGVDVKIDLTSFVRVQRAPPN